MTTKPGRLQFVCRSTQVWGGQGLEGWGSECVSQVGTGTTGLGDGEGASLGGAGRQRETATAGFSLRQGVLKFESRMRVWGRVAFLDSLLADSPNGSHLNFRKSYVPALGTVRGACSRQLPALPHPEILRRLLPERRPLVMAGFPTSLKKERVLLAAPGCRPGKSSGRAPETAPRPAAYLTQLPG